MILLIISLGLVTGFVLKPSFFYTLFSAQENTHEPDVEHAHEEFKKGPHQGRLLEEGDLQVEIAIFEPKNSLPKFRVYFYDKEGSPINPAEINYRMALKRINRTENIPFKQQGNYLESTVDAAEPHSFKVNAAAVFKGKTYQWEYASYEGRVALSREAIQQNSIKIEKAKPEVLKITLSVMGKIVPNEEATVFISPRFPGVVKGVYKRLGDYVRKGETLAIIESNESLQNYTIKSEIEGMVIKRDINIGMFLSGQENVFVISDLASVWADFNIYRHDLSKVKIGDPVTVTSLDGSLSQESTISYISPIGNESTQSVVARAVLKNPKEAWRPGLFISGEITVDNPRVNVAIKDSALQTYRNWDVVFISAGNVFEIAPVKIGRRDKEWVEIISGLSDGDMYVSENSYILKADLEKSGAAHDH